MPEQQDIIGDLYSLMQVRNLPTKKDNFYYSVMSNLTHVPSFYYSDFISFLQKDKFIRKHYTSDSGRLDPSFLDAAISLFMRKIKKQITDKNVTTLELSNFSEKILSISYSIPERKVSNFDAWIKGKNPAGFKKINELNERISLFTESELEFLQGNLFLDLVFKYLEDPILGENTLKRKYLDYCFDKHIRNKQQEEQS